MFINLGGGKQAGTVKFIVYEQNSDRMMYM